MSHLNLNHHKNEYNFDTGHLGSSDHRTIQGDPWNWELYIHVHILTGTIRISTLWIRTLRLKFKP